MSQKALHFSNPDQKRILIQNIYTWTGEKNPIKFWDVAKLPEIINKKKMDLKFIVYQFAIELNIEKKFNPLYLKQKIVFGLKKKNHN